MAKTTYWMTNTGGEKAQFTGADERDTWTVRGWSEADEPTDTDFVWMRHPDLAEPSKIPWGARDYWQGIGFAPSAPPEPVDLTRDPQLRDQSEKPAPKTTHTPAARPAAVTPTQEG